MEKMYLYRVRNLIFLIIIGFGLSGCSSTDSRKYRSRDTGSTADRRAAFEEQRNSQQRSSGTYQGPVVVLPILWYRW